MARHRRTNADRFVSLNPFFRIISAKIRKTPLGTPRLEVGPTVMRKQLPSGQDCIRRGAVWFVAGQNAGFHVDFYPAGIHIEAWRGKDRQVSVWVAGEYTERTLNRDLSVSMVAAGLTDMSQHTEVRNIIEPRKS